jgi:quercetin dioxygenase-like cupin family protein
MLVHRHDDAPWHGWREGVRSRVWSSAQHGANGMHMGEQIFQPGHGVPVHWHYYEEHVTVFRGTAEFVVNDEKERVEGPATVILPPQSSHGFVNAGEGELHIIGAANWPIHETMYVEDEAGTVTRGWEVGFTGRRKMVATDEPGR